MVQNAHYCKTEASYIPTNDSRPNGVCSHNQCSLPYLKVMPKCESLRASASSEAVISRRESKRMMTA